MLVIFGCKVTSVGERYVKAVNQLKYLITITITVISVIVIEFIGSLPVSLILTGCEFACVFRLWPCVCVHYTCIRLHLCLHVCFHCCCSCYICKACWKPWQVMRPRAIIFRGVVFYNIPFSVGIEAPGTLLCSFSYILPLLSPLDASLPRSITERKCFL